jgi:hypothetical protein
VGVSFAQEIVRPGLVRPSTPIAVCSVTGEGAHVGHVAKLVTFATLSKNGGIPKADELAAFAKHPYTLFRCLFSDFTGVVHICEHYRGIFPKVVGGARIVGHLWNRDVSQNRITSHLLDQNIRACDILLVVGSPNMSKLSPHPVAGSDDGTDFEVLQEHMLKLHDLFV